MGWGDDYMMCRHLGVASTSREPGGSCSVLCRPCNMSSSRLPPGKSSQSVLTPVLSGMNSILCWYPPIYTYLLMESVGRSIDRSSSLCGSDDTILGLECSELRRCQGP